MRILMIGRPPASHWRLPADADVVVCEAPGVTSPHRVAGAPYVSVHVPNIADLEQLLSALITHSGSTPESRDPWWCFDAVYCDYEHALVNAAVIASLVGARTAMSPSMAVLARDKWRQKQLARAAGLRTAEARLALSGAIDAPGVPLPLVVKPLLGSAGRDIRRYDDAALASAGAAMLTATEPAMFESFIDGPECHIDAVVVGGRLNLLTVGFYLTNIMHTDQQRPTGSCIVAHHDDPDLYTRAEELMQRASAAFGVVDGVLHLEAFDTADGFVFSECGFRRAGGKSSETVALSTGVDYRELACLASLGLLEASAPMLPHRAAAWVMVKSPKGRVLALPDQNDFASIAGLEEAVVHRDLLNTFVDGMPGAYQRAGHVIVTAADTASARAAVVAAAERFQHGIVVDDTSATAGRP